MNHSPEPWKIEHRGTDPNDVHVVDANDTCVLETDWVPGELERLDYRRIVACVNFCRHLPTEWMKGKVAERHDAPRNLIGLIPVCKEES